MKIQNSMTGDFTKKTPKYLFFLSSQYNEHIDIRQNNIFCDNPDEQLQLTH